MLWCHVELVGHLPVHIQEVFHVYLNKFDIAVSYLFLIIFCNNEFILVNLISRNL